MDFEAMNMMRRYMLAGAAAALCTCSGLAIDGSWRGDLRVGLSTLPLVLNFTETDSATTCTIDSPNQNAFGIPATVDYAAADSVAISAASLGAAFCGHVNGDTISGRFVQRGFKMPLTLTRQEPLTVRRPQTPQPPFPYQEIDTVVYATDGIALRGTITLPESYAKGATPMCVFLTGSGPQNRDEEIFEHRPFAVIADHLARHGVASFRYDDRGTSQSEGDFTAATIATFLDDARSALLFARDFNGGSAGIIGHSEGGSIALLLAEERLPDFVVSLAGMAVSGKATVIEQNRHSLAKSGFDAESIDATAALLDKVFDEMVRQAACAEPAPIDVDALVAELGVEVPAAVTQSLKANVKSTSGYFSSLLALDPRVGMAEITCPVLALNGSLDTQVLAADNLGAISSGVRGAIVKELPGLNHLFQHAQSGEVAEYGEIRETISPEVLDLILAFVSGKQ